MEALQGEMQRFLSNARAPATGCGVAQATRVSAKHEAHSNGQDDTAARGGGVPQRAEPPTGGASVANQRAVAEAVERQEAAAAAVRRKREAEEAARLKLEAERGTLPADLAHADAALSSTKPFCAEHPVKEAPSEPSRTVGLLPPAPERQESLPSVSRFVDAPNSADHHSPTVRFTVTPAREPARDATGGGGEGASSANDDTALELALPMALARLPGVAEDAEREERLEMELEREIAELAAEIGEDKERLGLQDRTMAGSEEEEGEETALEEPAEDEQQQRDLELCEETLAAAELHIQLLRATLEPERPASISPAAMAEVEAEEEADDASPLLSSAHLHASLGSPRIVTDCNDSQSHLARSLPPSRFTDDESERGRAADLAHRALQDGDNGADPDDAPVVAQTDTASGAAAPTRGEGVVTNRAAALRSICRAALGDDLFDRVYRLLCTRQANLYAADYDVRLRAELLTLMGEERLKYWPLVDQLLFLEELEEDSSRPTLR